jgi:hypothetical protein
MADFARTWEPGDSPVLPPADTSGYPADARELPEPVVATIEQVRSAVDRMLTRPIGASPLDFDRGVIPPGRYAQGGRSPIVWVLLCAGCAGFAPFTPEDYSGFLSGTCNGCGCRTREMHRFRAWIDSAAGCGCRGEHPRVRGDLSTGRTFDESDPTVDAVGGDPLSGTPWTEGGEPNG